MELWFSEDEEDQTYRLSLAVSDVLHSHRSEFQKIDVLETKGFGRVLLLDGLIMLTTLDEFVYHEMITHIPLAMLQIPPRRVVVIGGGDGGTLRELARHPDIQEMVLCEIDGDVIETAKKFFPTTACGFEDPRVKVLVGDGIDYVRKLPAGSVDLLVIDSTDPIGPGEGLFTSSFYQDASRTLSDGGVMVAQTESPWNRPEVLGRIQDNIRSGFDHVLPYVAPIQTYPRGFWSWTLASASPLAVDALNTQRISKLPGGTRYLDQAVAKSAFALPPFFREKLQSSER